MQEDIKEQGKSLFKRVMFDKENILNRKEFIISYCVGWVSFIIIIFIASFILPYSAVRGLGFGLTMFFVVLFMQRLRYLGMAKWWAALAAFPITNLGMFIYLIIKGDNK